MFKGRVTREQGNAGAAGALSWGPGRGAGRQEKRLDEVRAEVDCLATGHIQPQLCFINEVSMECDHIHFRLWIVLCYSDR